MNHFSISGRLCADPEFRTSASGIQVAGFRVAVRRRTKPGEEQITDFFSCTAFGKTAEFVVNYGKKGGLAIVEGRVEQGEYTDKKDGIVKKSFNVVVDHVELPGSTSSEATQVATPHTASPQKGVSAYTADDGLPF